MLRGLCFVVGFAAAVVATPLVLSGVFATSDVACLSPEESSAIWGAGGDCSLVLKNYLIDGCDDGEEGPCTSCDTFYETWFSGDLKTETENCEYLDNNLEWQTCGTYDNSVFCND